VCPISVIFSPCFHIMVVTVATATLLWAIRIPDRLNPLQLFRPMNIVDFFCVNYVLHDRIRGHFNIFVLLGGNI
jgi:hypothetical protein